MSVSVDYSTSWRSSPCKPQEYGEIYSFFQKMSSQNKTPFIYEQIKIEVYHTCNLCCLLFLGTSSMHILLTRICLFNTHIHIWILAENEKTCPSVVRYGFNQNIRRKEQHNNQKISNPIWQFSSKSGYKVSSQKRLGFAIFFIYITLVGSITTISSSKKFFILFLAWTFF